MTIHLRAAFLAMLMCLTSGAVAAQGTEVAFGGFQHDSSLPVEITADQLQVDQADGSAKFIGNVLIGQGDMRLSANEVRVEYASGENAGGRIERLLATGSVVLVNGSEAAEAQEAVYTIDSGNVVLTGDVLLTQGQNALSANRMVLDLNTGTARMDGRVRTVLQSGDN